MLALLFLALNEKGTRVTTRHDRGVLSRLQQRGYIRDLNPKARSVLITPEGLARSRALFESLFCRPGDARP